MATLINRGFQLLSRGTEAAAAESVRYLRGSTVLSEALPATLSAPQIELITDGAAVAGRQFTWLLKQELLAVDGTPVRPAKFDRIEWLCGGVLYAFEVIAEVASVESPAVDPRSEWVPATVKLIR